MLTDILIYQLNCLLSLFVCSFVCFIGDKADVLNVNKHVTCFLLFLKDFFKFLFYDFLVCNDVRFWLLASRHRVVTGQVDLARLLDDASLNSFVQNLRVVSCFFSVKGAGGVGGGRAGAETGAPQLSFLKVEAK